MKAFSILIVDDNPVNLKLMKELLSLEGFDTLTSQRAEEALQLLGHTHPDLVLMDIALPGMNGLELTRKLKADPQTQSIVVVAVTAFAMQGDQERAMAAGCDGFITKPIDTRTFVNTIRPYLTTNNA